MIMIHRTSSSERGRVARQIHWIKFREAGWGGRSYLNGVVTDVRRKQSGFGMIKGLLQTGRLVLPCEPDLLKQLRGLEFETLPSGNQRIAVPDRLGHDDICDALCQAAVLNLDAAILDDIHPGLEA